MATFGDRIRLLRVEKGLKQKEIAGLLGFKGSSSIGKYEYNQRTPSPDTIIFLANYFQVSVDFLLGLSDIRFHAEEIIAKYNDMNYMIADLPEETQKIIKHFIDYMREQDKPSKPEL
jgi:transcriptional regulator with XRE-family HTH domain